MIFKGPGGFGRVLNIVMCMVMCVVLSVIILSTMQGVPGNETLPIFTLLSPLFPGGASSATLSISKTR